MNMLIVNIPIEPLEERYSAQWVEWFAKELRDRQYNTISIFPKPLTDKIKDGAFLDVVGTTYFKNRQMADIAMFVDQKQIPRDERVVFLIHDGWFPVEQIAYMRDMLGCYDWRIVGLFHAGTYDRWDQTAQHGMSEWGEDLENAWFKIYDEIVVASGYHANLLSRTRKLTCPIRVIPWKVEVPDDISSSEKENWVAFPHRHNPEKLAAMPSVNVSPYEWRDTSSCLNKRSYYEMLAKSKICLSFSLQETFGIAMVESVLLGCIPLVPDRLSYREMYPKCFRYADSKEMQRMLAEMIYDEDYHHAELFNLRQNFKQNSKAFFNTLFEVVDNL
jgi:hypothetical protein